MDKSQATNSEKPPKQFGGFLFIKIVISHNSSGRITMPLTAQDYLTHPEYGPMPQEMRVVAQRCCGLSKAACSGGSEVAGSNLAHLKEVVATKQQLDEQAVGSDPAGGSYS